MEEEKEVKEEINYIIVGDSGVGKTNLILSFIGTLIEEEEEDSQKITSYNKTLTLDDEKYNLKLWDTPGKESSRALLQTHFCKCECQLFVYDITNSSSFKKISNFIEQSKLNASKNVVRVLIGNKNDLTYERNVSMKEGQKFARHNKMIFFETSAKTGQNVKDVFINSAKIISKIKKNNSYNWENEVFGMDEVVEAKEAGKKNKTKSLCDCYSII